MANLVVLNPTLCDYCQTKPKYSGYNYCGKNCAAQVANLCDQCHLKPKRQGFDYCSKNCGSLANNRAPSAAIPSSNKFNTTKNPQINKSNSGKRPQGPSRKPSTAQNGAASGPRQQQVSPAPQMFIPTQQIPTMMASVLPHAVAALSATGSYPAASAALNAINSFMQAPQQPAQPSNANVMQTPPGAYTPPAAGQPLANTTNFVPPPSNITLNLPPKACRIPGCSQPVHADSGQKSDYCSMKHREEAVRSGVADACIMCLTLPQGGDDHFCGKACRDEALSKPST